MYDEKPIPLRSPEHKPRRLCSVCGAVSYSGSGTHPQCAQEQADASRVERYKAAQKVEPPKAKAAASDALKPWHKLCPKCRTLLHVRKRSCDCGHQFS